MVDLRHTAIRMESTEGSRRKDQTTFFGSSSDFFLKTFATCSRVTSPRLKPIAAAPMKTPQIIPNGAGVAREWGIRRDGEEAFDEFGWDECDKRSKDSSHRGWSESRKQDANEIPEERHISLKSLMRGQDWGASIRRPRNERKGRVTGTGRIRRVIALHQDKEPGGEFGDEKRADWEQQQEWSHRNWRFRRSAVEKADCVSDHQHHEISETALSRGFHMRWEA